MSDGCRRLRVLSYNIQSQRGDQIALRAVIQAIAPDVAVIQEGPRRFRWRQRIATLAHSTDLLYAAGGLPGLGNVVLTNTRVRVDETWEARYPLTPGRHLRAAVFARCSLGRFTFVVAGSHLSLDPGERLLQAGQLKGELAGLRHPVVIGCDVNETSDGPAWSTLAEGLVDSALAAQRGGQATFPSSRPRARIDAVFIDPSWQLVGYQVVDTPETRAASDHLPIVVDFALPTEATT